MGKKAIIAKGLGKRYRIGEREKYKALRDVLTNAMVLPFRRIKHIFKNKKNQKDSTDKNIIWALKDVSFEVEKGEVVGIIGRNGAGKTTLLKILSRITEPTEGEVAIYGRVGALLEVGTGFHPELSGRENIYMNGSILGMRKFEIERKFDQIVSFAEIEKFIDTPVKHYSSGMYMRLAFAVAAHLEPEVLLVDEVLAVGDVSFQKKCLGKMNDVAREGRTVIFVSHNMQAILRLCDRVIILDRGKVSLIDSTQHATDCYLENGLGILAEKVWDRAEAPGDDVIRVGAVRVRDESGRIVDTIEIQEPVFIEVEYWQLHAGMRPSVGVHLWNAEGICLFASYDFNNKQWYNQARVPALVRSTCCIPANFLAEGRVAVELHVITHTPAETHHFDGRDLVSFQVIDQSDGDGVRGPVSVGWMGVVRPMLKWTIDLSPLEQPLTEQYNK